MNFTYILAGLTFFLGIIYIIFSFIVYSHTLNNELKEKMLALSPWWPLYGSSYDDYGKRLCVFGKLIIFIDIVFIILLYLLWK